MSVPIKDGRSKKKYVPTNILTTAVPSWLKVIEKGKDRRIEIIPERAKIVERIYDRFLEGCGTGHIAIQLNEEGIQRHLNGRIISSFKNLELKIM